MSHPAAMTRPSFDRRIWAGFGAVAALLSLVVALALSNAQQFHDAAENADRAQQTLRELQRVLATMVDAETGTRGYLLTGNDAFLEPYHSASASINGRVANLKDLLQSGGHAADFSELESAISAQMAFRMNLIERVKSKGGGEAARAAERIDVGKPGMDRIRAIILQIESAQEKELAERMKISDEKNARANGMLMAFTVLALGLLIGGIFLVRHQLTARERMQEERQRFFTLSNDLYCVANSDGFFVEVNPAAERILGYTAPELTNKPFIEFVHPDDRAATMMEAQKLNRGERTIYFENRYQTKSGEYKWMLWSASPAPGEKRVYAVARDITERKVNELRLAHLVDESKLRTNELEAVNKELEAFSYSVSHDLRAPLRHIAGFSDMLQRHADGTLDDKGKRYLSTIMESAKRMGMLIDDLLVFSRMGRSEMHRQNVDLSSMVDEAIAELAPEVGNRDVNWKKWKLPNVVGDNAMLRQAILNLLSNALKYSATRNRAEIEIGCKEHDSEFVFFVRDNGVGFDMAYAHKLFGVFQRLHDSTQFEGTGIGLANVRRIVSRHGGKTWAEAELDKGATFYFSLPKLKLDGAAA